MSARVGPVVPCGGTGPAGRPVWLQSLLGGLGGGSEWLRGGSSGGGSGYEGTPPRRLELVVNRPDRNRTGEPRAERINTATRLNQTEQDDTGQNQTALDKIRQCQDKNRQNKGQKASPASGSIYI